MGMSFREMLEQVKAERADPECEAAVKAEIEKHEVIADYLAERFDEQFSDQEPPPSPETGRIARRVRFRLLGSACLAVGTWISALTENQILAYLATFGALLVAYIMDGIQTMFTTGNLLAFIAFMVVVLIAAILVGDICKRLTAGVTVFCVGAVVLFILFRLRPAWLLTAFNAVLSALALFDPFQDIVGGMFSIPAIVYYLSVIGLFLFLTGQALERRRWN